MAFDIPAHQLPIYAVELILFVSGLVVWGAFLFGKRTAGWRIPRLQPWPIDLNAFLVICLKVVLGCIAGGFAMHLASTFLPKAVQADSIFMIMVSNLGIHLGAVGGALVGAKQAREEWSPADDILLPKLAQPSPVSTAQGIVAGILTFVAAMPIIGFVSFCWQLCLTSLGVPFRKQELLDLFGETHDPAKLATMCFIAVVAAPLAEELAFRAGLYRFFRGRTPRWVALVVPSLVFASLHLNVAVFAPLFALGLVFSLAYERTGRILVTVIAHGLFNLNTILLVLLNVNM